jgi:hypothetical protein
LRHWSGKWGAVQFLYELGVTLEWAEVWVLARLGGWVPHKNRRPGKIVLMRGLRRLMDMLVTDALLRELQHEQGAFPPKIAALLKDWNPPHEL